MSLHCALCELRNPPAVRWRWLSVESALMIGLTVALFAVI